jgi:hypothetical protein
MLFVVKVSLFDTASRWIWTITINNTYLFPVATQFHVSNQVPEFGERNMIVQSLSH